MNEQKSDNDHFSVVLITLMKGVLYADDNPGLWQALIDLQARIRDYVAQIGLALVVFEDEGFAWLRTREIEGDESKIPRLVARRQFSYPVSLLLALLRRKLAEHDAGSGETRLILDRDDIVELVRTFLLSGTNEAKIIDQIDTHIQKVIVLGFARRLRTDRSKIEVRRILKAFIDAQWLEHFNARLNDYLNPDGELPVRENE